MGVRSLLSRARPDARANADTVQRRHCTQPNAAWGSYLRRWVDYPSVKVFSWHQRRTACQHRTLRRKPRGNRERERSQRRDSTERSTSTNRDGLLVSEARADVESCRD
eukprot:3092967-Rhodomonas_salina.1